MMKDAVLADAVDLARRSGEWGWGETGPWAGAGVAAEPCEGDGTAVGVGGGAGERAGWGVGGVWEEEVRALGGDGVGDAYGDEETVGFSGGAHAADDFLADVAALVVVDVGRFEAGFGWEDAVGEVAVPIGDGVEDHEVGGVGWGEGGELGEPELETVWGGPDVGAGDAEARVGDGVFGFREERGELDWGATGDVDEGGGVREIVDGDIVGDDVFFETRRERVAEGGWGVEEDGVWGGVEVDDGFEAAFEVGDGGWEDEVGGGLGDVVGELAVEVAEAV
jgi:hypothetical protein